MFFYTWKDIERYLFKNKNKWIERNLEIEVYASELVVSLSDLNKKEEAHKILTELFNNNYHERKERIVLDMDGQFLNIIYDEDYIGENNKMLSPLFKNVLYQQSAYYETKLDDLSGCPVIAFHSYKGGVGRTLSLLAFTKAWSALADNKKLLIIDSDIEAPGITWLMEESEDNVFSYLDLLEIIQGQDKVDDIITLAADKVNNITIKVETETRIVEHVVIPTYRYIEQLLDIYSSPESIVNSYNKKYWLAEVFSRLGEKIGADAVLIDLRAGISEFSAPILFDPRVKKYIVTSTSYQSIEGTKLLLQQLNKGLSINKSEMLPEILLTMGQNSYNASGMIEDLMSLYHMNESEDGIKGDDSYTDDSYTDDLLTELPFASELVHLGSLSDIMNALEGRDFYKNIYTLVKNDYKQQDKGIDTGVISKREENIRLIHELSEKQVTAEENIDFNILMTQPIKNLIKKFSSRLPTTIIMGAKGSGKTFLYKEILKKKYWKCFVSSFQNIEIKDDEDKQKNTIMIPLVASTNSSEINEILTMAIHNYNTALNLHIADSFWMDNGTKIKTFLKEHHEELEWVDFWRELLIGAWESVDSLKRMNQNLEDQNKKIVFLVDGLEELFRNTLSSENEQFSIQALCQDLMNELEVKFKNIGCIIFLRQDLAHNSIGVNYMQFHNLYKTMELNWSNTEALRLVVWLVSQAIPSFYHEDDTQIDIASSENIEKYLVKLWGTKLGKPDSKEAYSSRWILAALSDFNGQLQARDVIRFLQYATEKPGRPTYNDRFIMPTEIRNAVPKCSEEKITEIKQEINALKDIFDKLEKADSDIKTLPFYRDTFNLTAGEEKVLIQEGYLRVDNDKYYLPEIIRHTLNFKYKGGARPKVLSLLLKRNK